MERFFVIMHGTTGDFKTECRTFNEAWALAMNNFELGFDSTITIDRGEVK